MSNSLNGYHSFFTYPGVRDNQYWAIDALAQLASALFWKHNFGPIHLCCDERHLQGLRQYGIDRVYDSIDTGLMERMPPVDERYWSYSKIFMAQELAQAGKPFAIIDTDLWLRNIPPTWNSEANLLCLHPEEFDTEFQFNPYIDPREFISPNSIMNVLPWAETLPLNCGVIYLNSPSLVEFWYQCALEVLDYNQGKPALGCSREIVFLEQRLLATLAKQMLATVGTLIPSVYSTQVEVFLPGATNPWNPPLDSTELLKQCESSIRHIWGLKRSYNEVNTRRMVVFAIRKDIKDVLGEEVLRDFSYLLADVDLLTK